MSSPASTVLAIDPGSVKSAWLIYDGARPLDFAIDNNDAILNLLGLHDHPDHFAIEMVASYGMPVGADVFETCVWIGRFIQAVRPCPTTRIYRKDVKMHLCQSMRAKDTNIRQALIDRFPATGGGKVPQIGTKKQPGPLYDISKDVWSALAVAVTWWETKRESNET